MSLKTVGGGGKIKKKKICKQLCEAAEECFHCNMLTMAMQI